MLMCVICNLNGYGVNTKNIVYFRAVRKEMEEMWFRVTGQNTLFLDTLIRFIKDVACCPTPNICFLPQSG